MLALSMGVEEILPLLQKSDNKSSRDRCMRVVDKESQVLFIQYDKRSLHSEYQFKRDYSTT